MNRLMFGQLVAFGDPRLPGADPEWIPVRSWYHLKPDATTRNKASGEAGAFWFVKVIDLALENLVEPPQAELQPEVTGAPPIAPVALPPSKRGPKGKLTAAAASAILADLRSGAATVESLRKEKQEAMAYRYGVGARSTFMQALTDAASRFEAEVNLGK